MQYRKDKNNNDISILGYGCMRFSHKGQGIDIEKAEKEILRALENGVNYYDTAYIYPGSEVALGQIVDKNNIRDKIKIATKLPHYMVKNINDVEKIFNEELTRLKTDYIDYYLMHMLTDLEAWNKLISIGILDWIEEKKSSGKIRNIGFSFHGDSDMFIKILDAYEWEFCQIQYNYIDEHSQAGVKGLKAAAAKGIPVIIMEPLRGGKLVNMLPERALKAMKECRKDWTPAEWGLKWLWNQPEVTCVLSGMNSIEMVDENCRIASQTPANSLSDEDFAVYETVKNAINNDVKVPCTGCRYCMPCPKGVDIPSAFSCYNHMYTENKGSGRREYWQTVALRKEPALPSQCIGCGKCESHCPQHIAIREELKKANKELLPWYYKLMAKVSRWFMFRK